MLTGLIINDNKSEQLLIIRMLRDLITFDTALNGYEGIMLLKKGYDVIILDLEMPILNGLDVLESMKKEEKLKTVVMTNSDDGKTIADVYTRGCFNFLNTNASRNEVEHTLRKMKVLKGTML